MGKSKELSELLESDSYLAKRFTDLASAFFSKAEELRQLEAFMGLDSESRTGEKDNYPTWYYHFVGNYQDDGEAYNKSYLDVRYRRFDGDSWLARGKIKFSAYGRSVEFPVLFHVRSGQTQRFYFSCYADLKLKQWIPIPMPIISNLRLFGLYWRRDGEWDEAKVTFDVYQFCESWYCKPDDEECIARCRDELGLDDRELLDDPMGISFGDQWTRSPLLILTPFRSRWESYKSPEYFDSIELENDSNREMGIANVTIFLNSVRILQQSVNTNIPPNSSLRLTDYILEQRRRRVINHLPDEDPSYMTPILEAAAQNIGQTWEPSYLCGWLWRKEYDAWRPIPNDWCGDYVRGLIRDYSDLDLKPKCDVCVGKGEHLWSYFGRLNRYYTGSEIWGEYRISPRDINPDTFRTYRWQDLATAVKPGYAASLAKETEEGEKTYHQTIFINWEVQPAPNRCRATFWAIGGNQSDSINDMLFSICNGDDPNCWCDDPKRCCTETDRLWGEDNCFSESYPDDPCPDVFCNFFGRTIE